MTCTSTAKDAAERVHGPLSVGLCADDFDTEIRSHVVGGIGMVTEVSPLAGKPSAIDPSHVPRLDDAPYFSGKPDPAVCRRNVCRSVPPRHRGSALNDGSMRLTTGISQALCDHRQERNGVTGPLFLGLATPMR